MEGDYYDRLGVPRDASTAEIKQAYRDRIKETHPDVSDDESAHERTKRLIEAKDVLIDEAERRRYDRLGHAAYVGSDGSAEPDPTPRGTSTGTADAGPSGTNPGSRTSPGARATAARGRTNRNRAWQDAGRGGSRKANGGQAGRAEWYDTSARTASGRGGGHRAWDTDGAYAVGDDTGMFEPAELLSSQRTVVLLGTTFVIYPVLLFGALLPTFPTAVNLVVAMCLVLVIAFLQSVPRIGMLVFGTWTILLPIGLFGVIGLSPLSLSGVLAMAAVSFPFGLSVLSWIAIRPMAR